MLRFMFFSFILITLQQAHAGRCWCRLTFNENFSDVLVDYGSVADYPDLSLGKESFCKGKCGDSQVGKIDEADQYIASINPSHPDVSKICAKNGKQLMLVSRAGANGDRDVKKYGRIEVKNESLTGCKDSKEFMDKCWTEVSDTSNLVLNNNYAYIEGKLHKYKGPKVTLSTTQNCYYDGQLLKSGISGGTSGGFGGNYGGGGGTYNTNSLMK